MRRILVGLRNFARDPAARGISAVALALIGGGTTFYRFVEGWSWLDSYYFTVIALTTVGFGDLAPATRPGKLFTTFYVVIGIGVLVALVTEVARHLIEARPASD